MELRDDVSGGLVSAGAEGGLQLQQTRARLALVALVLTAVRLAFAGAIHLTEDEAYYRLWAQHLQPGYYDHPPMIALWIRLGVMAAGDTAFGVRLVPTLATGAATWFLGDTALRLGLAPRTALRAGLWWNATVLIGLGGFLATPDAPAAFFWTLCLWCLASLRATAADAGWWLGAGLAAGLSCLSKYSGLFLAPGVLLWLALTPAGFAQLRRPWPWAAALVAGLVFLPNVAWNAAHGWLTFHKQFGRVAGHGLHPGHLPEFLLTQFLLLNPLLAILAARAVWEARPGRGASMAALRPLAAAAPFLLYLTAHSLHDRVQGHWPAPTYGAFAVAAAAAAETRRGGLARAVPWLGLGLSALALVHLAAPRWSPLRRLEPGQPLLAWDGFAASVEALRVHEGAAWVGVDGYGLRAQLAAERKLRAPVIQIIERERWFDWDGRLDVSGPGLVLDLERRVQADQLSRCFAVVAPAGTLERGLAGGRMTRYVAFRVQGPKVDLIGQGCPWRR
jgi:4-amino-4-deoxy-L-arabinose transferase-like glycosyltransferase